MLRKSPMQANQLLGNTPMSFNDEHAIETYKSLISISTEGFKALQLLNGGAVLAVLAYLGQMAPSHPELISRAKLPMILFVAGLAAGTLVYATSYRTQYCLHNENRGQYKVDTHKKWLWISSILCLASLALFAAGAFESLDALSPCHIVSPAR